MTTPDACLACTDPSPLVRPDDTIPLCNQHWNWWLTRYLMSADNPPCNARLIEEAKP